RSSPASAYEMNADSSAYQSMKRATTADNRQHLSVGHRQRARDPASSRQGVAMMNGLDELMRFQADALKLRSYRQELLSANIANADTPNYKAVDFDFAAALKQASSGGVGGTEQAASAPALLYRQPGQASIDGNSGEMDAERAKFA